MSYLHYTMILPKHYVILLILLDKIYDYRQKINEKNRYVLNELIFYIKPAWLAVTTSVYSVITLG